MAEVIRKLDITPEERESILSLIAAYQQQCDELDKYKKEADEISSKISDIEKTLVGLKEQEKKLMSGLALKYNGFSLAECRAALNIDLKY